MVLDPLNAQLVFQLLQELIRTEKITTLTICHDHDLISEYCDGQQLEIDFHKNGTRSLK